MKKTIAILIAFVQVLFMASCAKTQSEGSDPSGVDAAAISQRITAPRYAVVEPGSTDGSWTSHSLSAFEGRVYYIASQGEQFFIRSIFPVKGEIAELTSFSDLIIRDLSVSPEGGIFLLAHARTDEYSFWVIELDSSGTEMNRWDLTSLKQDAGWNPREIEASGRNVYLLSDNDLISVKADKSFAYTHRMEVGSGASLTRLSSGQLALGYIKDGEYCVSLLDGEKLRVAEEISFNMPFIGISGGETWDLFLSDSNAVYAYSFAESKLEKLFSWNGIGITSGSLCECGQDLVCSGALTENTPNPPLVLQPIEQSQEASAVIKFATTDPMGLDFRVQTAIREWNMENPQCPIEIVDYSVYASGDDKRASTMKLTADIVAGNLPDLYDFSLSSVDTVLSSATFARRGLLEDLYPFLDADSELSREDLIPGVLSGMEIKGSLYEFVPQYSLVTTLASTSIVGTNEMLSYPALMQIIDNSDSYESIFDKRNDRMFLLGNVVNASGKKLIDWDKGECYFDSVYFQNLLQVFNTMPEKGLKRTSNLLDEDVKESPSLLYYYPSNDVWLASVGPLAFGEEYCFPGLPEIGNVIYPTSCYGISSLSQHKEECWRFLRQFWTEDYKMEFFLTPRYDGLAASIDRSWKQIGEEGKKFHSHGLEAMNKLVNIIEHTENVYRHDQQIWQIVYSETGAYFAGEKSIEDTIQRIQAKVSLYMAEQG